MERHKSYDLCCHEGCQNHWAIRTLGGGVCYVHYAKNLSKEKKVISKQSDFYGAEPDITLKNQICSAKGCFHTAILFSVVDNSYYCIDHIPNSFVVPAGKLEKSFAPGVKCAQFPADHEVDAKYTTFPASAAERKTYPIATGVLDYFPDALAEVAHVSFIGNEQHNPGTPLHWDRSKSGDEADACVRHLLERGKMDSDGVRHSAKAAWRALANLQKEIEADRKK